MQETLGSIPGSERCPGEGNGNPLQHSCLRNSMDRGAWRAIVQGGYKESDTPEWLSTSTHLCQVTGTQLTQVWSWPSDSWPSVRKGDNAALTSHSSPLEVTWDPLCFWLFLMLACSCYMQNQTSTNYISIRRLLVQACRREPCWMKFDVFLDHQNSLLIQCESW